MAQLSTVWQRWQSAAGPWQGWASLPVQPLTAARRDSQMNGRSRPRGVGRREGRRAIAWLTTLSRSLQAGGVMVRA